MRKRYDFSNESDLKTIKKRISISYKKQTGGNEGSEDCVQEVITRMLEGRHQHATINQAVIDYLRECRNLKGFRRNFKRENYPVTNSYEQGSFDRFIGSDTRGNVDSGIDFRRLISMSKHWEKAVMNLYYMEEYGLVEIGNFFGVSESRVHQWVQRIQKRISTRINSEERASLQRNASSEMAKVLSQETKRISGELGIGSFERMEIGKSWQMDSFNEASF